MRRNLKEDFLKSFKNQSHIEQLKKVERKFETFQNETTNATEITIYGIIGDSWWDDSVSAADIDNALKSINGDIVINLNSPGGDAFDGIAIYNRLKKHDGKVIINIDGWACSAASVIAMAADELNMGMGSMIMIHEASTIVWGSKTDMRKEADVLDNLEDGIIDIYMTKANVEREEMRNMVDAETWFSAQKAIEIGFATATSSTVEDNDDDELTQMKVEMQAMKDELHQLKNMEPEKPTPVKQNRAVRLF
ncbi:head maturation protease, ClpP-related [Psychrobacillus sp. FSL H8-0487]|uniref:head maturation protease, ClpP-related n=1 Tax=Psychrobacillus sp. FSL H8-0487 TaxID=2921391 RepID=UPI0030F6D73F